jgi:glycosyltransferase involved in cell wall biosynthesis
MRISILTPSYNQGRFLERNIQSVLDQDVADVEHIVMDAGSADDTVAILNRYNERVQWRSEKDNGQADALNKALKQATGDIVGWLNVDEYYEPRIFRKIIDAFERSPDAMVVYGDFRRVTADGATIRINRQWRFDYAVCQVQTPIMFNCAAFFRRDRLMECGGFDVSWTYLLDWELYIRFMRGNQGWVKLNEVLGNFTMHPQSKTATSRAGFDREIQRLHLREFPGWSPEQIERHRRRQEWRMRYHMLLDGVIAEKIWFKLVRQKLYGGVFGIDDKDIPLLSPLLRWISGNK